MPNLKFFVNNGGQDFKNNLNPFSCGNCKKYQENSCKLRSEFLDKIFRKRNTNLINSLKNILREYIDLLNLPEVCIQYQELLGYCSNNYCSNYINPGNKNKCSHCKKSICNECLGMATCQNCYEDFCNACMNNCEKCLEKFCYECLDDHIKECKGRKLTNA